MERELKDSPVWRLPQVHKKAPYKKRKRVSELKFNNFEYNTCTDVIVQVFVPGLPEQIGERARPFPPPGMRSRSR